VDHLPENLKMFSPAASAPVQGSDLEERLRIANALERTAGNKARAARLLGMDRKTLYRKMSKYGVFEEG